MLQENYRSS